MIIISDSGQMFGLIDYTWFGFWIVPISLLGNSWHARANVFCVQKTEDCAL